MQPASPVIPGSEIIEVTYGADQPQYIPLPVFRTDNIVMSRWKFSDEERAYIAAGGDLFITQMTFGQGLQPILPMATSPEIALESVTQMEADIGS
jgi:hypothetical protein